MFRRQLITGLMVMVCLIVLLGGVYPLAVWAIGRVAFRSRADGSLARSDGRVVGSSLLCQEFTDSHGNPLAQYFQPRPSAAGTAGCDPTSSGGSNLGPSNPVLLSTVANRVDFYRRFNGLSAGAEVPVDAVTASGSGLDPDISVANALEQAPRVARARHLSVNQVAALVRQHTDGRPWGFLGERTVNVLDLNLALDRLTPSG